MRYKLLRDIKTGIRFYAEYSDIAGEWYEVGTGEAHQDCDVECVSPEPEDKDALAEARKYADVRLSENDPKLYDSKHTRHRKMGQVCFAGYEIEQAYYDGIMNERARVDKRVIAGAEQTAQFKKDVRELLDLAYDGSCFADAEQRERVNRFLELI